MEEKGRAIIAPQKRHVHSGLRMSDWPSRSRVDAMCRSLVKSSLCRLSRSTGLLLYGVEPVIGSFANAESCVSVVNSMASEDSEELESVSANVRR
jgi:hypothetical protein